MCSSITSDHLVCLIILSTRIAQQKLVSRGLKHNGNQKRRLLSNSFHDDQQRCAAKNL